MELTLHPQTLIISEMQNVTPLSSIFEILYSKDDINEQWKISQTE